jgi:RNA polymerase sigma-70 factor (ECF subfamily)
MTDGADLPKNDAKAVEQEFLAAFDEHSDALFRHVFIRIRDREVAKDIVQETFTKTWDYLSKGKKVEHLRAFLYRVANNLIVDTSRRKRSSSLDNLMEEDGFEIEDETIRDPGDIPDARMAMKLLDTLDEIYRVVVSMRFIDGLTPKEISRALNVSENVVSVRLYRGIERLKSIVNKPSASP